jgi:hypothetical protein
VLAKMRANDKNFIITPYAEYNRLDVSTIKIREPDHLFDIDPANRRSNKRVYVDKDAVASSPREFTATVRKFLYKIKFDFYVYYRQWIFLLIQ